MTEEQLYKLTQINPHRYSLLNEIMAIRDNRYPDEKSENCICVNGYIGLDVINRYVRYIDELIEYENINTIKNCAKLQQENTNLKMQIDELIKWLEDKIKGLEICRIMNGGQHLRRVLDNIYCYNLILSKLKEVKK